MLVHNILALRGENDMCFGCRGSLDFSLFYVLEPGDIVTVKKGGGDPAITCDEVKMAVVSAHGRSAFAVCLGGHRKCPGHKLCCQDEATGLLCTTGRKVEKLNVTLRQRLNMYRGVLGNQFRYWIRNRRGDFALTRWRFIRATRRVKEMFSR